MPISLRKAGTCSVKNLVYRRYMIQYKPHTYSEISEKGTLHQNPIILKDNKIGTAYEILALIAWSSIDGSGESGISKYV